VVARPRSHARSGLAQSSQFSDVDELQALAAAWLATLQSQGLATARRYGGR
jgi:hypothetical protein